MEHIALDSENQLMFENGTFRIVADGAELLQNLRCRLLSYEGEYFLDRTSGVPYFQQIFKKPLDLSNAESILKQVILETDGVESIIKFAVSFNSSIRKLAIEFSIETIYGPIEGETLNV